MVKKSEASNKAAKAKQSTEIKKIETKKTTKAGNVYSLSNTSMFYLIDKDSVSNIKSSKTKVIENILSEDILEVLKMQLKNQEFEGNEGECLLLLFPSDDIAKIYFVGIGDIDSKEGKKSKESFDIKFQKIGGKIANVVSSAKIKDIMISKACNFERSDKAILQVFFGLKQKIYRFSKYITNKKTLNALPKLENIRFEVSDNQKVIDDIEYIDDITDSIYLVRDLINEPSNVLYPESFAKIVQDELKGEKNISIDIFGKKELEKLGANTMLSVAQGSVKEPKMVVIKYNGNAKSKFYDIGLVGKGVTFDSGGISIKPSNGMADMKGDMAGAATVFSAIKLLALRKAKVNAVALLGLVENMPSGTAVKPGDIVKSMSGHTVEILDTDAEGRLVLADVLYYCQTNFKPKYMIDFATLTGAVIIALGSLRAGIFSNSDEFAKKFIASGEETGDYCWQLPLDEEYNKMMDSKIADVKNISGTREASSITAAAFLQRFIDDNKNWIHVDIAGVSDSDKDKDLHVAGGSGFGIKLIDHFVKNNIEQ